MLCLQRRVFNAGELKKYLEENVSIVDSPDPDPALTQEADCTIAKCPHCNINMVKKHAPQDRHTSIDECEKCHGIWLDATELDRLELKSLGHKKRFSLELENLFKSLFRKSE